MKVTITRITQLQRVGSEWKDRLSKSGTSKSRSLLGWYTALSRSSANAISGSRDTTWLAPPRETRLTPFHRFKRLVESRARLEERTRSETTLEISVERIGLIGAGSSVSTPRMGLVGGRNGELEWVRATLSRAAVGVDTSELELKKLEAS